MNKPLHLIAVLACSCILINPTCFATTHAYPLNNPLQKTYNTDQTIIEAYENQQSNIQVSGKGRVTKILADDNDGSRHQRFIITLDSGHTLLIAHNIDLAPRINKLAMGDTVQFYGEYEWNNKGGVIHWTHHDPDGSHEGGWLKHRGKIYQ